MSDFERVWGINTTKLRRWKVIEPAEGGSLCWRLCVRPYEFTDQFTRNGALLQARCWAPANHYDQSPCMDNSGRELVPKVYMEGRGNAGICWGVTSEGTRCFKLRKHGGECEGWDSYKIGLKNLGGMDNPPYQIAEEDYEANEKKKLLRDYERAIGEKRKELESLVGQIGNIQNLQKQAEAPFKVDVVLSRSVFDDRMCINLVSNKLTELKLVRAPTPGDVTKYVYSLGPGISLMIMIDDFLQISTAQDKKTDLNEKTARKFREE